MISVRDVNTANQVEQMRHNEVLNREKIKVITLLAVGNILSFCILSIPYSLLSASIITSAAFIYLNRLQKIRPVIYTSSPSSPVVIVPDSSSRRSWFGCMPNFRGWFSRRTNFRKTNTPTYYQTSANSIRFRTESQQRSSPPVAPVFTTSTASPTRVRPESQQVSPPPVAPVFTTSTASPTRVRPGSQQVSPPPVAPVFTTSTASPTRVRPGSQQVSPPPTVPTFSIRPENTGRVRTKSRS